MGNLTLLSFSEPLTHEMWVMDSGKIIDLRLAETLYDDAQNQANLLNIEPIITM
jgi:hypothetical protein